MKFRAAVLAICLMPGSSVADDFTDMVRAREISEVIAASDLCGYSVEQAAADDFVTNDLVNMPEMTRMGFKTSGMALASELETASTTQRATTCTLMKALGKKHGLVK